MRDFMCSNPCVYFAPPARTQLHINSKLVEGLIISLQVTNNQSQSYRISPSRENSFFFHIVVLFLHAHVSVLSRVGKMTLTEIRR